ncbi:ATPase family associated with various cellular activities (AAA) [Eubacterium ruminantium]|nr:ATPase family associated with various cellular activities (AAA) [Eubacterium ruminantium]
MVNFRKRLIKCQDICNKYERRIESYKIEGDMFYSFVDEMMNMAFLLAVCDGYVDMAEIDTINSNFNVLMDYTILARSYGLDYMSENSFLKKIPETVRQVAMLEKKDKLFGDTLDDVRELYQAFKQFGEMIITCNGHNLKFEQRLHAFFVNNILKFIFAVESYDEVISGPIERVLGPVSVSDDVPPTEMRPEEARAMNSYKASMGAIKVDNYKLMTDKKEVERRDKAAGNQNKWGIMDTSDDDMFYVAEHMSRNAMDNYFNSEQGRNEGAANPQAGNQGASNNSGWNGNGASANNSGSSKWNMTGFFGPMQGGTPVEQNRGNSMNSDSGDSFGSISGLNKREEDWHSGRDNNAGGKKDDFSNWKLNSQNTQPKNTQNGNGSPTGRDDLNMQEINNLLKNVDDLIGLGAVKKEIHDMVNLLLVQKLRERRGLKSPYISRHLVFTGNPGTGKTTIARYLGKIYKNLGILSTGQMIETDRAGMVAGYMGQTAEKVREVTDKAMGGILFIDEAYTLSNNKEGDFGQEAIDTLLKIMEDHRDELIVIVAGYTNRMDEFLNSNPGLRSRFSKYIAFDDYTNEELLQIFKNYCAEQDYHMDQSLEIILVKKFDELRRREGDNFGNARTVRNYFEKVISNQANRIMKDGDFTGASGSIGKAFGDFTGDMLMTITEEDLD